MKIPLNINEFSLLFLEIDITSTPQMKNDMFFYGFSHRYLDFNTFLSQKCDNSDLKISPTSNALYNLSGYTNLSESWSTNVPGDSQ